MVLVVDFIGFQVNGNTAQQHADRRELKVVNCIAYIIQFQQLVVQRRMVHFWKVSYGKMRFFQTGVQRNDQKQYELATDCRVQLTGNQLLGLPYV